MGEVGDWDSLIMLLSTDWFLPFWQHLGLIEDNKTQRSVQSAARDAVLDMMKGKKDYYLIDFTGGRQDATIQKFVKGLKRKKIPDAFIRRLASVEASGESDEITKTVWMFNTLTMELATGRHPAIAATILGDDVDEVLGIFEGVSQRELGDMLETALKTSNSEWDTYVKRLTPGQITMLSDWVAERLAVIYPFKALWTRLAPKLGSEKCNLLLAWYKQEAKARTQSALDIRIPQWLVGADT